LLLFTAMRRKRHKKFSFRHVLSGWGIRARLFWYRLDKAPLIVLLVVGAVATGFGFVLHSMAVDSADRRSVMCLALNVYFEARGEPEAGQYAVAEVTMNRVASPYYPDTVCEVVYQKNWDPLRKRYVAAFSWTEFRSVPEPRGKEWRRAWKIAEDVYYERREPKLAGVLNYHAARIEPSWSQDKKPAAEIGRHRFYK
jgi:N-acetylmuramoyl-L-alanine amidase